MPIHIQEAPGFSGWTRLRDGDWKTMNRSEIDQMRNALEAEISECGCNPAVFGPQHSTSWVSSDSLSAHTSQCRSFSRWFNPKTRQMEGHQHCTCDRCF